MTDDHASYARSPARSTGRRPGPIHLRPRRSALDRVRAIESTRANSTGSIRTSSPPRWRSAPRMASSAAPCGERRRSATATAPGRCRPGAAPTDRGRRRSAPAARRRAALRRTRGKARARRSGLALQVPARRPPVEPAGRGVRTAPSEAPPMESRPRRCRSFRARNRRARVNREGSPTRASHRAPASRSPRVAPRTRAQA